MAKAKTSKEYVKFDKTMRQLLSVSKVDLDAKMNAHKATVDALPAHKRRGPKRKVTPPSGDGLDAPVDAS